MPKVVSMVVMWVDQKVSWLEGLKAGWLGNHWVELTAKWSAQNLAEQLVSSWEKMLVVMLDL